VGPKAGTEVPRARPALGPTGLGRGPVVFAVEDTTAQLTWLGSLLPAGEGRRGTRRHDAGPGAPSARGLGVAADATITARDLATGNVLGSRPYLDGSGSVELAGLPPASTRSVTLDVDGRPAGCVRLTTTPTLGPELSRFATLSDIHLGLDVFGLRGKIVESDPVRDDGGPIHLRAAALALDQLNAWGAEHLFIKGDLVDRSTPAAWALAGRLLLRPRPPVTVMTGNHEHNHAGIVSPIDGAASAGIDAVDLACRVDLPGLSVLCVNTIRSGVHGGRLTKAVTAAALDLARTAPSPVMVLTHHPIDRFNLPVSYPPGVPNRQGAALIDRLANECELLLVSSGHTHAHRLRTIAGVATTEVGSPKDFPGVWAGYSVAEGGVRQVLRRVDSPEVNHWLDHTRFALGGIWGRWSVGRLADRSLQVRRAAR
jgi:hypothetical protein